MRAEAITPGHARRGYGVYPVNDFMLTTIRAEAVYHLRRFRNHPSIVLWCGNSEDHMFTELHRLEYDQKDGNPETGSSQIGQLSITTINC